MNINEALAFIQAPAAQVSRLGLERVRELMARLGDPQKKLQFVHVAGTNGKGSTAAMLASVLTCAGYKTGLFTSPHLSRYNERIQIDGEPISDEDLCAVTEMTAACARAMDDPPTEFERVTALALAYYWQKRCDIVVLEVGLGGRLDATNVIDPPQAAVITNIGLEHTEILGDTLEAIAWEKAGIIKSGCAAVSYDSAPAVQQVLRDVCAKRDVPLRFACFDRLRPGEKNLEGQTFSYGDWEGLTIPLLGEHQLCNAAVALETIGVLRDKGWNISDSAVRTGLARTSWPARFEVLGREPLFILDGGHNPQCAQALAANIRDYLPGQKVNFLMGVLADKAWDEMLDAVWPYGVSYVCVTPESPRAMEAETLAAQISSRGANARVCPSIREAVELCAGIKTPTVAFGSLYMAGEIRQAYRCLAEK